MEGRNRGVKFLPLHPVFLMGDFGATPDRGDTEEALQLTGGRCIIHSGKRLSKRGKNPLGPIIIPLTVISVWAEREASRGRERSSGRAPLQQKREADQMSCQENHEH